MILYTTKEENIFEKPLPVGVFLPETRHILNHFNNDFIDVYTFHVLGKDLNFSVSKNQSYRLKRTTYLE